MSLLRDLLPRLGATGPVRLASRASALRLPRSVPQLRWHSIKACSECGTTNALASLQCAKCHTLQPLPAGVDYYEVLDVPFDSVPANGWKVDVDALKTQWRRAMALAHPDRLVQKSDSEQNIGAQQSTVVNKAYETLRHPLLRALYLGVEEGHSVSNPALLMEVMELQEALSEASDRETVDAVAAANAEHMQQVLAELSQAFEQTPLDTDRVRDLAVQLRYWTNLEKQIREWQPDA